MYMYVIVLLKTIYKIKSDTNFKLELDQNITSDSISNYNNGLSLTTQSQCSNKLHP